MTKTTYVVSTLNRSGGISKKMFNSFKHYFSLDFEGGYHFTDKKAAMTRRDVKNAAARRWKDGNRQFADEVVSDSEWVVINTKTMKVVTR